MNNKNKSLFKAIMPWLVVIILLSSLVPLLNGGKSSEVNYNQFVQIVDQQKVTEMTVMPGVYVTSVEGQYTKTEDGKEVKYTFKTNVPQ
ncbi:ATP-dependent metallopeptidase FtsH/Yme1/Tma family protein, partial [Candidatus Stoquefichus massiliensis]|uniref:ATP-dependent metallopeptidase FtsH/Yme1/Tma family protein n=1 Tax=Candidatus Stoquefichus massiliensis TaxID=1470350 RepID=UPI0005C97359